MKTTWKDIPPVPTSQEFLDIVLSRTQRRLPTQIRSGFQISRIRGFYTRKVRYTQETFSEKFAAILESFPRLNDVHPFHRDLLNTLYDADHFKIALGQLSTAKSLMETISRDYVRLLKYGQSLFQCKQLKRAALGRMATICKRLKEPLLYLDQVRQVYSALLVRRRLMGLEVLTGHSILDVSLRSIRRPARCTNILSLDTCAAFV